MKIDLHTHSILSHDGGITLEQYLQALESRILEVVAITDHNEIAFALDAQERIGERIIVGEEVSTSEGHLIGLFLTQKIEKGLSYRKTIDQIHDQGGLAYAPHPYESRRHGVSEEVLADCLQSIDLLETYNHRSLSHRHTLELTQLAARFGVPQTTGSDSHDVGSLGKSFMAVRGLPKKHSLVSLVKDATHVRKNMSLRSFVQPTVNTLRKKYAHYRG